MVFSFIELFPISVAGPRLVKFVDLTWRRDVYLRVIITNGANWPTYVKVKTLGWAH